VYRNLPTRLAQVRYPARRGLNGQETSKGNNDARQRYGAAASPRDHPEDEIRPGGIILRSDTGPDREPGQAARVRCR